MLSTTPRSQAAPRPNIRPTSTELGIFARRARFYNEVLGALTFSLALAALGTDGPTFYARGSMVFVLALMLTHGRQYRRIYSLWNELGHPLTKARFVWQQFVLFILGWSTLCLVALGLLTKRGIVGIG